MSPRAGIRNWFGNISPMQKELYADLPLDSLAAYVIALLDKESIPVTIENITVSLFKLFPEQFSLVGFPEFPDGMRANRTLLHMQPKYRNFATGSAKRGYSLTTLGRKIAEATETLLASEVVGIHTESQRAKRQPRTVHDEDLVKLVRESLLFQAYLRKELNGALGVDFLGMLGVFSHTPKNVIQRELKHLQEAAERQGDKIAVDFLDECKKKFSAYIR